MHRMNEKSHRTFVLHLNCYCLLEYASNAVDKQYRCVGGDINITIPFKL